MWKAWESNGCHYYMDVFINLAGHYYIAAITYYDLLKSI